MKIVITGASGGIGDHIIRRLGNYYGAESMIGTYFRGEPAGGFEYKYVDVTNIRAADYLVKDLGGSLNGVGVVLINAAGINTNAMCHRMDLDAWNNVLAVNLTGTFLMCRAFIPVMKAHGWGRIINISSIVGEMGVVGTSAYAASKAGILGLTRALAAETAGFGITVNALSLGYFNTGMIKQVPADILEKIVDVIPMGRLGNPDNICEAVRFLIGADYVTGQTIRIDGGFCDSR